MLQPLCHEPLLRFFAGETPARLLEDTPQPALSGAILVVVSNDFATFCNVKKRRLPAGSFGVKVGLVFCSFKAVGVAVTSGRDRLTTSHVNNEILCKSYSLL